MAASHGKEVKTMDGFEGHIPAEAVRTQEMLRDIMDAAQRENYGEVLMLATRLAVFAGSLEAPSK